MREGDAMRNRQRWIFAAGLVACGVLTAQLSAPSQAEAQNESKDKPKQASTEKEKEEVNVRYAQAYVRLMEAEIAKLNFSNRAVPGTIRPAVMEAANVALREAQDRVKLAQKSDDVPDHDIYVQAAKADLQYASESLRKGEAANLKFGGTVSDVEMARLKAQLELAKTRVEVANNLAGESPLIQAQYELEMLREQVQQMRIMISLLRDRN
jgi:hypothetical protein